MMFRVGTSDLKAPSNRAYNAMDTLHWTRYTPNYSNTSPPIFEKFSSIVPPLNPPTIPPPHQGQPSSSQKRSLAK